jgi:hypothetical protein
MVFSYDVFFSPPLPSPLAPLHPRFAPTHTIGCAALPNQISEFLDESVVRATKNGNASMSIFFIDEDGVWTLDKWSDVSHLAASGLVGKSAY